jgi:glycine cleavage system H protein
MSDIATYHLPDDRLYDGEQHLWVRRDGGTGQAAVGLDALGLAAMGDLAYVALHPVGTTVRRGEPIGSLEAAKMTGDLIAPISGVLVERNSAVLRDPTLINRDPYGAGWLVAIEPADWERESPALIAGAALPAWVAAETERYRTQGWIV